MFAGVQPVHNLLRVQVGRREQLYGIHIRVVQQVFVAGVDARADAPLLGALLGAFRLRVAECSNLAVLVHQVAGRVQLRDCATAYNCHSYFVQLPPPAYGNYGSCILNRYCLVGYHLQWSLARSSVHFVRSFRYDVPAKERRCVPLINEYRPMPTTLDETVSVFSLANPMNDAIFRRNQQRILVCHANRRHRKAQR